MMAVNGKKKEICHLGSKFFSNFRRLLAAIIRV